MDKKRLDFYRKKLQAKREELVRNIERIEEEGRAADEDTTVDLADKAANSYTKEFLFGQTNTDRALLRLIDEALKRIKEGSFGECANCEKEVQQKRLEAVPWAKYCVECQEKQERGQLGPFLVRHFPLSLILSLRYTFQCSVLLSRVRQSSRESLANGPGRSCLGGFPRALPDLRRRP